MNPRMARLLVLFYPPRWRERYGAEFKALLESGDGGLRTISDVVRAASAERLYALRGGTMENGSVTFGTMMKHPSAFLPVVMSMIALTVLLGDLAVYGVAHEAARRDEGAVAHVWQLLMGGQLPLILFFAIRWLPKAPRQCWPRRPGLCWHRWRQFFCWDFSASWLVQARCPSQRLP